MKLSRAACVLLPFLFATAAVAKPPVRSETAVAPSDRCDHLAFLDPEGNPAYPGLTLCVQGESGVGLACEADRRAGIVYCPSDWRLRMQTHVRSGAQRQ
jgi:hypothetical protein